MTRRLTRQEMKRDEVMEGLEAVFHFLQENLRLILMVLGAIVVVALAAIGVVAWLNARAADASEVLAEAIQVYSAPLAGESAEPGALTFPDAETRRERATALLDDLVGRYGSTDAARVGRLYLADIAAEEGRLDEARAIWEELSGGDDLLTAEIQLNLIHLDRQAGQLEEVEARLRTMLADPDAALPQDAVLRELAATLEEMGRETEAEQIYQRIIDEHPGSPYFSEAQAAVGGAPAPTFPGLATG